MPSQISIIIFYFNSRREKRSGARPIGKQFMKWMGEKMKKRIGLFLLALMLCVGVCSVGGYAAGPIANSTGSFVHDTNTYFVCLRLYDSASNMVIDADAFGGPLTKDQCSGEENPYPTTIAVTIFEEQSGYLTERTDLLSLITAVSFAEDQDTNNIISRIVPDSSYNDGRWHANVYQNFTIGTAYVQAEVKINGVSEPIVINNYIHNDEIKELNYSCADNDIDTNQKLQDLLANSTLLDQYDLVHITLAPANYGDVVWETNTRAQVNLYGSTDDQGKFTQMSSLTVKNDLGAVVGIRFTATTSGSGTGLYNDGGMVGGVLNCLFKNYKTGADGNGRPLNIGSGNLFINNTTGLIINDTQGFWGSLNITDSAFVGNTTAVSITALPSFMSAYYHRISHCDFTGNTTDIVSPNNASPYFFHNNYFDHAPVTFDHARVTTGAADTSLVYTSATGLTDYLKYLHGIGNVAEYPDWSAMQATLRSDITSAKLPNSDGQMQIDGSSFERQSGLGIDMIDDSGTVVATWSFSEEVDAQ